MERGREGLMRLWRMGFWRSGETKTVARSEATSC